MPEDTGSKQVASWFKPGQSGNPAGRPKGARSQLADDFLKDMYAVWQTAGKSAIQRVVEDRPHEFLKVVAGLLPKDINVKIDNLSEIDDAELAASLAALRSLANTCAAEIARAGAVEAEGTEPPQALRPVH